MQFETSAPQYSWLNRAMAIGMAMRLGILGPIGGELEDGRSWVHSKQTQLQMTRQRVYQIAAGYENCKDADFLRLDPSLRLAIGKGDEAGAGQSRLSRLDNEVVGTEAGLTTLENALMGSNGQKTEQAVDTPCVFGSESPMSI
jgi:hypothetical protein